MSEVVEVEPKKQDYRPGIKWELRLLVKRDDVVLATDDLTTRKDWINSLTSIMGKVSLATHTELQSRTISMEQLNRQLQATTAALEHENNQLRQELAEAQKRVRSQASEHAARESGLTSELEHVRLEMEQQVAAKTDDLEQQKMTWQAKAQEWQAQAHDWRDQVAGLSEERDGLLDERDRWMDERADLMDERNRWMDDQQQWMMMNSTSHHHHNNNRRRQQPSMNGDDNDVRDVKYQLQSLRDQLKDPLLQTHVLDIKSGVSKLMDTFDDARRGWSDLQTDLVKLLQVEEKDRDRLLDAFQTEFLAMRDSSHSSYGKLESLLAELQASHTQLVDSMAKNDDTKALDKAIEMWQQEQRQWMDDMQTKILAQLSVGGGNNKKSVSLEPTQDPQAHQKFLLSVLERHMDGLKDGQDRGREEDDKSFKVLGQLFQHVIQQLDEMAVPDITPSLDELADRLMTLDERLQRIQLYRDGDASSSSLSGDARTLDDEDVRELVIGTRGFMERTLRVLDRFGGSQSGLEETVRRAVKNAFNSHFMDIKDPHGNEERLKRYEENARGYIDKAMSGMRGHLEDYTGVMYKMIEDLILRAVQHLDTNNSNVDTTATTMTAEQHDRLKTEITRLKKERDELERQVKDLGLENNQAAVELAKTKTELQACTAEYERVQRQIQQARQDSLAAVARDLEPLVRQINLLKQATPESFYSDDSEHSGGFVDLGPSRVSKDKTKKGVN
jgi:chromosome segregation ATPase